MLAPAGVCVERSASVVRHLPPLGQARIIWSSHGEAELDDAITREIAFFRGARRAFEWKVYAHDRPSWLRERLVSRGLRAGPAEALLVRETGSAQPLPRGVDVRRAGTPAELEDFFTVERAVWPGDDSEIEDELRRGFNEHPEARSFYVAFVHGRAAAAASISYRAGSRFAGLFGGSTLAEFRGRGLYAALIEVRAFEARARHVPFLTVDALPTSRPILERLGFRMISTTWPCTWYPERNA